jgi:hypothetical protein
MASASISYFDILLGLKPPVRALFHDTGINASASEENQKHFNRNISFILGSLMEVR